MATVAECHVVLLVLDEQVGLPSVRLMAGETTERSLDLALVGGIHYV